MAKQISEQTGMELVEDSITQADIDSLAVETVSEDTENDDNEDGEDSESSREKWTGGYRKVFASLEECQNNPITKEDGSLPDEKDAKTFKVFVIKYRAYLDKNDSDPDNMSLVYCWARNTLDAVYNVATATFEFHAHQYGATRGRRKKFVPDENYVKLAMFQKQMGNADSIKTFIDCMPDYSYIFNGTPAPEYCTPRKPVIRK